VSKLAAMLHDSGIRRWALIAAFSSSFLCPINMAAQHYPFARASGVTFTIRTDQKEYEIGDQIVIHYTIRNVSNHALFVPRAQWDIKCGNPPHMWARLFDSSGNGLPTGYAGSCLGPDPIDQMSISERMAKDAVLLQPTQFVAGSFTLESKVVSDKLRSGNYQIRASLHGWRNELFTDAQLTDLAGMKKPFLSGEATCSANIAFVREGRSKR
jgi:hypothetical protein